MKIFILEDSSVRIQKFIDNLNKQGVIFFIAKSAEEAYEILSEHKEFDLIFLDHDLGGKVFVDSNESNTGYQVAKFITKHNIKSKRIIAHSLNNVGAENIKNILPQTELISFFNLFQK